MRTSPRTRIGTTHGTPASTRWVVVRGLDVRALGLLPARRRGDADLRWLSSSMLPALGVHRLHLVHLVVARNGEGGDRVWGGEQQHAESEQEGRSPVGGHSAPRQGLL